MTVIVCNACGEPWQGPGSPAICPKCGAASFAIAVERSINARLHGEDKGETRRENAMSVSTEEGGAKMTMEEKVRDILAQYSNDEVMLDAFFQWANGHFRRIGEGKHAWAQEKAYGYFLDNLRLRYGLSATKAEGVGTRLEEECKALVKDSTEFEVKSAVKAALSGPTGDILRKNVQLKVDKASISARGLLALYHWLGGFSVYSGAMTSTAWAGPLEALYRAVFGTLPGSQVKPFAAARDELISYGVINKSFYVTGSGNSYDVYLPGILVPKIDLSSVAPPIDEKQVATYLESLFTGQAFEQVRIVEEVALHGVAEYNVYQRGELPGDVMPHHGLFAYVDAERGKVAAVSPLGREIVLKHILRLKTERIENMALSFETALARFRDETWPESELTRLSDKPDRRVWRLDKIGASNLFIFIGNWLSQSDLGTLRNLAAEPSRDGFVFALTNQSLPSIEKVIANSLKMWQKASITVVTSTPKGMVSHQLQGTAHPSLSRILELLEVQPPLPPAKYRVEIKVTDSAGAALANVQVNIGMMSTSTFEDGRAVFEVSAGSYRLMMTAKGYETFSEIITINKDEQKTVQLRRVPGKDIKVLFLVKDQASQPVHGVLINFGPSISVTTGSDGTATLSIASGRYEVRLSKAGYNTIAETIEVIGDITKEFILTRLPQLPKDYKITFPPYDDGSSLVFGRRELKDKIAWGYEVGKELSPESLVTTDLFDINEPHVASFQQTRYGKSTLAGCVALQVAFQGVPVVVIDPKPDYAASLIPIAQTIAHSPDLKTQIEKRFKDAFQDMRGFDLSQGVEYDLDGQKRRITFQLFSFDQDLGQLPNCKVLKMPLIVLPSLDEPRFKEQCDSAATNLAACLPKATGKGYNVILSEAMALFKKNNPEREFMLEKEVLGILDEISSTKDKRTKTRIDNLGWALREYCVANSSFLANDVSQLTKLTEIVRHPDHTDSDQYSVSLSVIDVSTLPQGDKNPAKKNYVSQLCGQLYHFVRRRSTKRPVRLFIMFDEAKNYLPDPTDPFNYTLLLINQGASLGVKTWVISPSPQDIEKQARKQFSCFVLAKVPISSVHDDLSIFGSPDSWRDKLQATDRGKALIMNQKTAPEGGLLCVTFTTPQTINILKPKDIVEMMKYEGRR